MEAIELLQDIYITSHRSLTQSQINSIEKILGISTEIKRDFIKFPFKGFNTCKLVGKDNCFGYLKEIDGKWFHYGADFLDLVKEDDEFEVLF